MIFLWLNDFVNLIRIKCNKDVEALETYAYTGTNITLKHHGWNSWDKKLKYFTNCSNFWGEIFAAKGICTFQVTSSLHVAQKMRCNFESRQNNLKLFSSNAFLCPCFYLSFCLSVVSVFSPHPFPKQMTQPNITMRNYPLI
jgi:hypothetical protein